jgi:hypothetical protein
VDTSRLTHPLLAYRLQLRCCHVNSHINQKRVLLDNMFHGWEISTLTFDKNDFCTRFLFLLGVDVNYPVKRKKKHSRAVSSNRKPQKKESNMSGHCEMFQGNAACLSLTQSPILTLENQESGKPTGFMRKANKLSPKKHT